MVVAVAAPSLFDGEDGADDSLAAAAGVAEVDSTEANVDDEAGDSLPFSSGCSAAGAGVGWFRLRSDERPRS